MLTFSLMRSFLFFFLLMFSLISCTFQRDTPHGTASKNPSLWSQIENTTWREDNGWAGITYVFFTDDH